MQTLSDKLQREQDALFLKWCQDDEGVDPKTYIMSKGSNELTSAIIKYHKMKKAARKKGIIID